RVLRQKDAGVGQPSIGSGEAGIALYGLLEILRGKEQRSAGSLIPGESPLEIEVIRIEVPSGSFAEGRVGLMTQSAPKRRRDGPGDLFLDSEDIGQLPVVSLRPELVPVTRTHQLCGDPELVPA